MVRTSKKVKSTTITSIDEVKKKKDKLKTSSATSVKALSKSDGLKHHRKQIPLSTKFIFLTESFVRDLECIQEMFSIVIPVLEDKDEERKQTIVDSVEHLKSIAKDKNKEKEKIISVITKVVKDVQKVDMANKMFRANSIVLMVSRLDEFLADILKVSFRVNPEKLKILNKTLTYEQVLELKTIEKVQDFFINKEVDTLLYASHGEQLEFLDTTFEIGLKKEFKCWKNIIEITERRNLFVHAAGIVNKQYLDGCKKYGVDLPAEVKEGSCLEVSGKYFQETFQCFFEFGIRVGQAIFRRLFQDSLKEADHSLCQGIGYPLLESEQWELAKIVFDFACKIPKKLISCDEYYKIFLINLCIALKNLNQKDQMNKLLDGIDWSAVSQKFVLAVNVLRENYLLAESIMSTMNGKEPISEHDFRTWPLFRDFRKTEYFERAFKQIYKTKYEPKLSSEATQMDTQGKE